MIVNGHSLNVEHYGVADGPMVVLLHHGLGSVHAWKDQIPALEQAGYHLLVYDRWGYGASDARPALDLPTFNTDLEDLSAILLEEHVHRAALVGHSDGGTLALYFAARHPTMVRCLVTVAAHIYVEPKMEPGIRGVRQAFEHDERFRMGLQRAHGEKYADVFHNWYSGWHRIESLRWDLRPLLSHIQCPTLVVQGEDDEHATPQHARDIAGSIPGAELWLLPGAQHMLPQENADLFNRKMLEFLELHRDG